MTVIPLPERSPAPKRRGRPEKQKIIKRRCTEDFDEVTKKVRAVAPCKINNTSIWQATKERAAATVRKDRSLAPCAQKVLACLLDHVNREKGFDWHGIRAIGAKEGLGPRTVQKAFTQLSDAGYIIRDYNERKQWRTTFPCLVAAAEQVRQERMAKNTHKKSSRTRTFIRDDTHIYSSGHAQKVQKDTNICSSKPLKRIPKENPSHNTDASARVGDIENLLEAITTPNRKRVVSRLIDPLVRVLTVDAPDPTYVLGKIADEASTHSDDVLDAARKHLLQSRAKTFKALDVQNALGLTEEEGARAVAEEMRCRVAAAETKEDLDTLFNDDVKAIGPSLPVELYDGLVSACNQRAREIRASQSSTSNDRKDSR